MTWLVAWLAGAFWLGLSAAVEGGARLALVVHGAIGHRAVQRPAFEVGAALAGAAAWCAEMARKCAAESLEENE